MTHLDRTCRRSTPLLDREIDKLKGKGVSGHEARMAIVRHLDVHHDYTDIELEQALEAEAGSARRAAEDSRVAEETRREVGVTLADVRARLNGLKAS